MNIILCANSTLIKKEEKTLHQGNTFTNNAATKPG